MEKSRAIELLKLAVPIKALTQQEYADFVEAVNMAIDALKEQLSKQCTTSDLISRQAVLDAIVQCTNCGDEDTLREYVLKHSLDNGWTGGILEALDAVKDLPSVQPEPHEGHWINGKCDLCGEHAPFWAMASTYHESKYCPNCGAKMKGGAEWMI